MNQNEKHLFVVEVNEYLQTTVKAWWRLLALFGVAFLQMGLEIWTRITDVLNYHAKASRRHVIGPM